MASIVSRNGSFRITVSLGYDIYGNRIRETATFIPDQTLSPKRQRQAAEEYAREFEAKIKSGAAMDGRKITLKAFTDQWLSDYAPQMLHTFGVTHSFNYPSSKPIARAKLFQVWGVHPLIGFLYKNMI